ncbi:RSP_7527 family protein [Bradyrhizobium sp.]|uniref:RSP_7527 family protein n=1 Tax=Bradyrhizobium sp. TaxID=376 RepID=UPI004037693C
MFRESNFEGRPTSAVFADEVVLRRPDGSIDFDAYTARARRARSAAVVALLRAAFSLLAGQFAGKSMPAARHRAT